MTADVGVLCERGTGMARITNKDPARSVAVMRGGRPGVPAAAGRPLRRPPGGDDGQGAAPAAVEAGAGEPADAEARVNPVEPIDGELLRYRVASDNELDGYLVDLAALDGNGICQCKAFQIQGLSQLKERRRLGVPGAVRCKHIHRARAFLLDQLIQRMLKTGRVQDDVFQC